jgi:uncharacterized membrane protein YeiH
MPPTPIFSVVDLIGVFTGALSGALIARNQRNFDVVGVWGLALVSGVGGGLLRDLLLQRGTPLALSNRWYLILVTLAALLGFVFTFGGKLARPSRTVLQLIDAIALGNFAVAGTLRALDAHLDVLPAILLGILTATGGGLLRDVLLGIPPVQFQKGNLYAIAALLSCLALLLGLGAGLPRLAATIIAIVLGATLRLLSLRFGWTAPLPLKRW